MLIIISRLQGCWKVVATSLILGGALALGEGLSPIAAASENYAWGQIASDNTLGSESSLVTSPQPGNFQIDGGAARETNLFHSFSQFSVPTNGIAYFNNTANIQNIISRVTGGSVSNIDGLIRANSVANLFLLNPNGIIFGPNASLNIGGSFLASTASSLNFADGRQFSATAPQTTPLLTVSVPMGLQFGQAPTRQIVVQGVPQPLTGLFKNFERQPGGRREEIDTDIKQVFQALGARPVNLRVPPGKTLALVGGDIALLGGNLTALGGRVELGSVVGSGLVSLNPTVKGWALGYEGVERTDDPAGRLYGNIQLSQLALVNVSGISGISGGDVQVQGEQVTLLDESALVSVTGNQDSGGIYIRTKELNLENGSIAGTGTLGLGKSGDLTIETDNLTLLGSALIEATAAQGNTGNLAVRATTSVSVLDNSFILTGSTGSGAGGKMSIDTQRLSIRNGGEVSNTTFDAQGESSLTINALGSVEVVDFDSAIFTDTFGTAAAADLTIVTPKLTVSNGAQVSAATLGTGAGGNLVVNASEFVNLSGSSVSENRDFPSGLFASSGLEGFVDKSKPTGKGGTLSITTGNLTVRDGAEVTVSSLNATSDAEGAGEIQIQAANIILDNEGKLNATTNSGQGGNIKLQDLDLLLMGNRSSISAQASINANGGNITIDAADGFIVASPGEDNDIIANASAGQGGDIDITTQGIFGIEERRAIAGNETNDIDASSRFGVNGVVEINTPDVYPSQGLVELPDAPVNVEVAEGCQTSGQASIEFFNTGRGGLAPNPYEPISSRHIWEDVPTTTQRAENSAGAASPSTSSATSPNKIVEAQEWLMNEKGEVILVAEMSTSRSQDRCRLR